MGRKLVIDLDTGVDDAVALMLALCYPDVEVLGVTCVFGNTDVENVCTNTLRVMKICGKTGIPVFRGAFRPLVREPLDHVGMMGKDGLGEVDWPDKIDSTLIQPEPAVEALLRLVNENPGEITLVCLASLTNVALALKLDPDFGKKLKAVYLMGGTIEGQGNASPTSEFNILHDPEAAHIVFHQMQREITIFPIETCFRSGLPWDLFHKLCAIQTEKAQFLVQIATYLMQKFKLPLIRPSCDLCDFFAMAGVLDNDVIVEQLPVYATIELHGEVARGLMVIDWHRQLRKEPNVRVVKQMNVERLKELAFFVVEK